MISLNTFSLVNTDLCGSAKSISLKSISIPNCLILFFCNVVYPGCHKELCASIVFSQVIVNECFHWTIIVLLKQIFIPASFSSFASSYHSATFWDLLVRMSSLIFQILRCLPAILTRRTGLCTYYRLQTGSDRLYRQDQLSMLFHVVCCA